MNHSLYVMFNLRKQAYVWSQLLLSGLCRQRIDTMTLLMIDFHGQEDTRTGRSLGTKCAIRPGGKDAPELEKGGWVECDEVTGFEPFKIKGFNMI